MHVVLTLSSIFFNSSNGTGRSRQYISSTIILSSLYFCSAGTDSFQPVKDRCTLTTSAGDAK